MNLLQLNKSQFAELINYYFWKFSFFFIVFFIIIFIVHIMWKLLGTDDATLRLIRKTFFWIHTEPDYYGFFHETGNKGANDPLLIVISFTHFFWTQSTPSLRTTISGSYKVLSPVVCKTTTQNALLESTPWASSSTRITGE